MTLQARGRANTPLIVQVRATSTDADSGQVEDTWSDSATIWASVENRGGVPKGAYEYAMVATERKVCITDYRSDIAWSVKDHRLKSPETGTIYNITEITDPGLKHHVTELTIEELQT